MRYDIHNVSDASGYSRTISVRHIRIPPGRSITIPGPLPKGLDKPAKVSGLLVQPVGSPLPEWVIAARKPSVAPAVEEVAIPVAVPVDLAELKVAEMALIYEEVTGGEYSGRRRRADLTEALESLDQRLVAEAIG